MTPRTASRFVLCVVGFFHFVSSDAAETLSLTVDCTTATVNILRSGGIENEDLDLELILAKDASVAGCGVGSPVEARRQVIEGGAGLVQLAWAELGIEIPSGCGSYVVGALVESFQEGGASAVSSCSPPASPLTTLNCNQPPLSEQIESDLIFYNRIDLGRIGSLLDRGFPTITSSCLPILEYVAEVRSRPTATVNYDVAISARYICSSCAEAAVPCASSGGVSPGPGWNTGAVSVAGLAPDTCFDEKFIREVGGSATNLPGCCDTAKVAMQCGRIVVTRVGATLCSTPYFGPLQRSDDGGVVPGFSCKFEPTHSAVLGASGCQAADSDLDGMIDGCLCGNGVVDSNEGCDGADLGGMTCEDECGAMSTGTLRCAPDCLGFDATECSGCIDDCKWCPPCDVQTCPECCESP